MRISREAYVKVGAHCEDSSGALNLSFSSPSQIFIGLYQQRQNKQAAKMTSPNGVTNGNGKEAEIRRPDSAIDLQDDYVLTRDAAASARLNLSHYVWHSSFGYNLHPRIQQEIQGKENLQVADIGTGTGSVAALVLKSPRTIAH